MTTPISTIDLHVHSKYSGTAEDWYLNLLQASESYTEIEEVYQKARLQGRQFVTITDHDQISGVMQLKEKYPDNVLTGVESTVLFPEDRCKVHILVFGLSENDFWALQRFRKDIYQFRDYIKEKNLAYSVAHPLLAMDRIYAITHLEKLTLLFDVFETRNGSQSITLNNTWFEYLSSLTPERIEDLYRRYRIEPISDTPWQKGYTGGSDDHGGLYIGRTYTIAEAQTANEFLVSLKNKNSMAGGAHGTYQELANSILKVTYETLRRRNNNKLNHPLVKSIAAHTFEGKPLSWYDRAQIYFLQTFLQRSNRPTHKIAYTAINHLTSKNAKPDENVDLFTRMVHLSDDLLQDWVGQLNDNNPKNPSALLKNVMANIAGLLVSLPYFAGLGFIQQNRSLINDAKAMFHRQDACDCKKTLWFSDDISEAVSIDLFCAPSVKLVQSFQKNKVSGDRLVNLPQISFINIDTEKGISLSIPSPLRSLEILTSLEPDQIIISTTGPIGILGLIYARLMKIPAIGFIQPDFHQKWFASVKEDEMKHWLQQFHSWFISLLDQVIEPQVTKRYSFPEYLLRENQPVDMKIR